MCDPIEAAASAARRQVRRQVEPRARDAIEDASVDAVLIGPRRRPTSDLLRASVLAGKKILCEKPIDLDMAKIDATWAGSPTRRRS